MRTLVHVSAFVLIALTLISVEDMFVPNQANAGCCMCYSRCNANCTCPGSSIDCPTCYGPDNIIINAWREVGAAVVVNSDSIDRLIRLAGNRQCLQNNSRLQLLEVLAVVTFDPVFVDNNRIQGNVIAQQMTTGNER